MQDSSTTVSLSSTKRVLWDEENGNIEVARSNNAFLDGSPLKRIKTTTSTPTTKKGNPALCTPVAYTAVLRAGSQNKNGSPLDTTPKRDGYLSWDDYFFAVALLSAKRSKDPEHPAGACLVDSQHRIVGIGYNGLPRGCSDEVFPWNNTAAHCLHTKHPYVCPAVTNAILNHCSPNVEGCSLYTTCFPNSDCSKVMIQSQIRELVVLGKQSQDENDIDADTQASAILLQMAGIRIRYCQPERASTTLHFVTALAPTSQTAFEEDDDLDEAKAAEHKQQQDTTQKELAANLLLHEANYNIAAVENNGKSSTFLSWPDYFMSMAFLTAQRSKDPNTQVGACIVDTDNRIVGLGYNGFPRGCSDECLPWARSNDDPLHNKYLYVCHAEVNAILNKGSANVRGATLYVALFPCNHCAKLIIQAGIAKVIYMSDSYHETDGCKASRIMLQCAGVKLQQYIPSMQSLELKYRD